MEPKPLAEKNSDCIHEPDDFELIKKKYKYFIINSNNDEIFILKNFDQIVLKINEINNQIKISKMLISRRFKNYNYFKINNIIIKKLIWC